jgi:hypothetical protein
MPQRTGLGASILLLNITLLAQDPNVVKVPITDPSRPAHLKAEILQGSITVRGYEGKEVIVDSGSARVDEKDRVPEKAKGLRRIDMRRAGLTVEEQDNRVVVSAGHNSEADLVIQVPRQTSLYLRLTNGGGVTVENIEGEIDANVTNGHLTLKGISGSVVAHALNDNVTATIDRVTPGKPMSFSTLNGDVDVTLPANAQARLKMKTDNGEIYTDFELKLEGSSPPSVEPRSKGGRYRVKVDHSIVGTINGGGPDYQFTSLNGTIYIRKK